MLITFEGGDCGGKDTQIELLKSRLIGEGYSVSPELWEPGSTLKAEVIRLLLKDKYDSNFKFPGDFIKTFNLAEHRAAFEEEELPQIAVKCLEEALKGTKNLGSGIKYETIYFLIHNDFIKNKKGISGNLAHTINYLNNEEMSRNAKGQKATPAELLLKNFFSEEKLGDAAQMYLFLAARNILYHDVLPSALEEYDIVPLNRSDLSTVVYQGHAQNKMLIPKIRELNREAMEGKVPDITVLLDIPVEEIEKRKSARLSTSKYSGSTEDFFDKKDIAFHGRIREGYLKEAEFYMHLPKSDREYGRIKIISGIGTTEEVHDRVWDVVRTKINNMNITRS